MAWSGIRLDMWWNSAGPPKHRHRAMRISVILCTFNRCQVLPKALESVAASVLPASVEWEILVVDNNSQDQTRGVVEEFCQRFPGRFRYVCELQQGLSHARNAGIRQARGEILAFTDDDVTVEPDWLQNLTADLHNAQWAGSGGRILPERTISPPPWLALKGALNQLGALCAYTDPGDAPGDLKSPPYGANMAFRRKMFDRYGYFRTDLGHRPDSKIGFEDTEFGHRLMAGGERLRYVPSATVYHYVDEGRLRKNYFLAWWFDFGRGHVRASRKTLGVSRVVKVFGRTLLSTLRWLLSFDPQRRFYQKCWVWYGAGRIVEVWTLTAHLSPPLIESEMAGAGRM
jgi:glycosyltransferase involved in cell wall biosynthesis